MYRSNIATVLKQASNKTNTTHHWTTIVINGQETKFGTQVVWVRDKTIEVDMFLKSVRNP